MLWSLLPSLLLVTAQGPNDAEKLFLAAEKNLADAKSVQISVTSTFTTGRGKVNGKATLLLGKDNQSAFELITDVGEPPLKIIGISNGTRSYVEIARAFKQVSEQEVPKDHRARWLSVLMRSGFLPHVMETRTKRSEDKKILGIEFLHAVSKTSDFALGKMEMVGKREAQVVTYKFTLGDTDNKADAQVWLDKETKLPLKRVFTITEANGLRVEEVYDIRINVDIDAKKFALPK